MKVNKIKNEVYKDRYINYIYPNPNEPEEPSQ